MNARRVFGWSLFCLMPISLLLADDTIEPKTKDALAVAAEPKIQAGETVVVTTESVEFGLLDKVAAVLKNGDRIRVTEVRGDWVGGYTIVDGQRKTGWVHHDKVKVRISPSAGARIVVPDVPDDPASVTALKEAGVEFELDDKGRVQVANASESNITDAEMSHFGKLHHLAILELSGRPISDDGVKAITGNVALQQLFLDGTKIGDNGLKHLATLGNLEFLVLQETAVTDEGMEQLGPLQQLRTLNLGKCGVTDKALRHLSKLVNLEVLALPETKITSKGLAYVPWLERLRVLNVNGDEIDDDGIYQLRNMEELRMLYVRETEVTDEGAEDLGDVMPSLAIYQ